MSLSVVCINASASVLLHLVLLFERFYPVLLHVRFQFCLSASTFMLLVICVSVFVSLLLTFCMFRHLRFCIHLRFCSYASSFLHLASESIYCFSICASASTSTLCLSASGASSFLLYACMPHIYAASFLHLYFYIGASRVLDLCFCNKRFHD